MKVPDRHEATADAAAAAALSRRPRSERTGTRGRAPAGRRTSGGGHGRPLTDAEAAYFEPRFGVDFSSVRIHSGSTGRSAAQQIGAQAFTKGSSITFAREPDLGSASDRLLFAHELAHVVQQRREPSLAGTVQRQAAAGTVGIRSVVIHLGTGDIRVTLTDKRTFAMNLVKARSRIEAGTYRGVHVQNSKKDDDVQQPDGSPLEHGQNWAFDATPADAPRWIELADSTYELVVRSELEPVDEPPSGGDEEKGKEGETGKGGAEGPGVGDKSGEGAGEKDAGDEPGEKAGEEGKKTGESDTGGLPPETAAEKDAKVVAVLNRLEELPDVGGTPMTPEQVAALAEMTAAELDDVIKFLKNAAVQSETPIDTSAEMDKYLELSPSDRELLRVNQQLMKDAKSGPLPDRVRIALESSAEANVKVAGQIKVLNDGLQNLAAIKDKVKHPDLKAVLDDADLDPIDLEKLPVFREMMMLEGLMAGASTRSPQIEESSKDLTKSIAGIRDYVLEEIAWLLGEMAASAIIGVLAGPVGAALSVGRVGALVYRLNKLRLFLQNVEQVYSTFQRITAIVARLGSVWDTYKTFESEFVDDLANLDKLRDLVEDPNLDEAALEAAIEKVEELEEKLVDRMLAQLESGTGVGLLLEYFDIPEDASPDDLRQILFDIPKGLRELDALRARYNASGRDLEAVKLLTYKSVLVGTLLYPFVGYLVRVVGDELGRLTADQDLSTRLREVLSGAAAGAQKRKDRRKVPTPAENKKQLGGAKRPPKTKKPDEPDDADAAKKKKDADPAKKKDADDADPAKKKKKAKDADDADGDAAKKPEDADPEDKKKDSDPSSLEWIEVERKVNRLPDLHKEGITKRALEAQGKKIKKAHKKVAGAVAVRPEPKKGWWTISIARKGGKTKATAKVLMGYRKRWEVGRRAIEAEVENLDARSRSIPAVKDIVERKEFKDRYDYTLLEVVDETREGHRGVKVVGRMGQMGQRDIVAVEDLTGLCTGEYNDPLHIWWYKDPSWYQGYARELKLHSLGVSVPFPAPPGREVEVTLAQGRLKGEKKVTIGVKEHRIVKEGSKLQRKRADRSSKNPDRMKRALKQAGYSRWDMVDLDHVHDLGMGGDNGFDNLWPLDRSTNQWIRRSMWYQRGLLQLDPVTRRKAIRTNARSLYGKWFYVRGISVPSKDNPLKWGGRNPDKTT